MKLKYISLFPVLIALNACGAKDQKEPGKEFSLLSNQGFEIGTIFISDKDEGVHLRVNANEIFSGQHGIHFHHTGTCIVPDFKSAGGHINPEGKAHGLNNPDGPDNADMPNADANADSGIDYEYLNTRLSFYGKDGRPALFDENGSALVIHQNPDDGITQPIGGAGPRIACAEIK